MRVYERALISVLTGVSVGAFFGCLYGWWQLSLNADYILDLVDSSDELDFFTSKAWMMGISITGFVTVFTYYFGWVLEKINQPGEVTTVLFDNDDNNAEQH
tara:strand:+ start:190 stop:492 length:303 start_codon:yes stop_codon:yes gene_type:complete